MKTNEIRSGEIPYLTTAIKEMINQGMWFLFEAEIEEIRIAKYILKAGNKMIALDNSGKILESLSNDNCNYYYKNTVYFTDLPFPKTLSNMVK